MCGIFRVNILFMTDEELKKLVTLETDKKLAELTNIEALEQEKKSKNEMIQAEKKKIKVDYSSSGNGTNLDRNASDINETIRRINNR